jgi:hypothetical protein
VKLVGKSRFAINLFKGLEQGISAALETEGIKKNLQMEKSLFQPFE